MTAERELASPGPSAAVTSLTEAARGQGLIVFAGAGVSMVCPTCLPGWYAFNETVLRALASRLAHYTKDRYGVAAINQWLERRKSPRPFSPDYIADVISEEVGAEYFRVLQALDTDDANAAHVAVAALAEAGFVRAVITTNFDRLFERTFEARGIAHHVFSAPSDYEALRDHVRGGDLPFVPIVKVHESVDAADTMVDTMSPRLRGRPRELNESLAQLYAGYHVLFLGSPEPTSTMTAATSASSTRSRATSASRTSPGPTAR